MSTVGRRLSRLIFNEPVRLLTPRVQGGVQLNDLGIRAQLRTVRLAFIFHIHALRRHRNLQRIVSALSHATGKHFANSIENCASKDALQSFVQLLVSVEISAAHVFTNGVSHVAIQPIVSLSQTFIRRLHVV